MPFAIGYIVNQKGATGEQGQGLNIDGEVEYIHDLYSDASLTGSNGYDVGDVVLVTKPYVDGETYSLTNSIKTGFNFTESDWTAKTKDIVKYCQSIDMQEDACGLFYLSDATNTDPSKIWTYLGTVAGVKGEPGESIWVRFADSDNPETMSLEPVSAGHIYKYIGIAGGKTAPEDPHAYAWVKFVGDDAWGYQYFYRVSNNYYTSNTDLQELVKNYTWSASGDTQGTFGITQIQYQNDGWYPEGDSTGGWTDDPQNISKTNRFQYMVYRKKTNNSWGNLSVPVLFNNFALDGESETGFYVTGTWRCDFNGDNITLSGNFNLQFDSTKYKVFVSQEDLVTGFGLVANTEATSGNITIKVNSDVSSVQISGTTDATTLHSLTIHPLVFTMKDKTSDKVIGSRDFKLEIPSGHYFVMNGENTYNIYSTEDQISNISQSIDNISLSVSAAVRANLLTNLNTFENWTLYDCSEGLCYSNEYGALKINPAEYLKAKSGFVSSSENLEQAGAIHQMSIISDETEAIYLDQPYCLSWEGANPNCVNSITIDVVNTTEEEISSSIEIGIPGTSGSQGLISSFVAKTFDNKIITYNNKLKRWFVPFVIKKEDITINKVGTLKFKISVYINPDTYYYDKYGSDTQIFGKEYKQTWVNFSKPKLEMINSSDDTCTSFCFGNTDSISQASMAINSDSIRLEVENIKDELNSRFEIDETGINAMVESGLNKAGFEIDATNGTTFTGNVNATKFNVISKADATYPNRPVMSLTTMSADLHDQLMNDSHATAEVKAISVGTPILIITSYSTEEQDGVEKLVVKEYIVSMYNLSQANYNGYWHVSKTPSSEPHTVYNLGASTVSSESFTIFSGQYTICKTFNGNKNSLDLSAPLGKYPTDSYIKLYYNGNVVNTASNVVNDIANENDLNFALFSTKIIKSGSEQTELNINSSYCWEKTNETAKYNPSGWSSMPSTGGYCGTVRVYRNFDTENEYVFYDENIGRYLSRTGNQTLDETAESCLFEILHTETLSDAQAYNFLQQYVTPVGSESGWKGFRSIFDYNEKTAISRCLQKLYGGGIE